MSLSHIEIYYIEQDGRQWIQDLFTDSAQAFNEKVLNDKTEIRFDELVKLLFQAMEQEFWNMSQEYDNFRSVYRTIETLLAKLHLLRFTGDLQDADVIHFSRYYSVL